MSLFGDDYSGPPSRAGGSATKSSLFDDDDNQTESSGFLNGKPQQQSSPAKPNTSMFGDAADDDEGGSPWASFTPKKQQRRSGVEVVRSLLADSEVPETWVDAWEALDVGKTGVVEEADARRAVIEGCGLRSEVGDRIWGIVCAGAESRALGRGQFWVLLALVGLALEGEDLGLDSVDERRGRLPVVPGLPAKEPERPATPPAQVAAPPAQQQQQQQPQLQQQQSAQGAQSSPVRDRGGAAGRKPSFGFGESDPWASPEMHKGHGHTNGVGAPAPPPPAMRTTSDFSTTAVGNSAASIADTGYIPTPPTTSEAASSWGASNVYTAPVGTGGFGPTPEAGEGFGEGDSSASTARRSAAPRTTLPKGVDENITVAMLDEKEGMFLFQHRNYEVGSIRRNSKVIRRYSDFVWLLECLHKRYPFRQLPLLPPKRMSINGNHIAADKLFIEKRRRGLVRFINALVRHPVLREEQLVIMFLTVPTVEARPPISQTKAERSLTKSSQELAVWRKQATISVQEEFIGRSLPPTLEDSLPQNLQETFETVRSGVRRSADLYINLCNLVERLCKRKEAIAAEYGRFGMNLTSITESTNDTFAIDVNDVPLLNEGIKATAKHLSNSQGLLEDESRAWDEGVLEDLKSVRDGMVALRDLFDRKDRLARDNIPQLEKRIMSNENKLSGIKAKGEAAKPGEAEKVETAIVNVSDRHRLKCLTM
jgi:sorting nexin-8